jgi:biopolymer transport protein ExbB
MSFELSEIIAHMGFFARLIAVTLLIMAVASLAVFLERLVAFARSRSRSRRFGVLASDLLADDRDEELLARAAENRGHLAALLGAGMKAFLAGRRRPGQVSAVELARRELLRKSEALAADVRRGLGVLVTVGSVAPFVGLLGTVVGIIDAFQGIAAEGSGGLGAVSSGIAEALVVTALGLLVAIPAVLAFNLLSTRSETLLLALDQARGEFVDHLESRHGHSPRLMAMPELPAPLPLSYAKDSANVCV